MARSLPSLVGEIRHNSLSIFLIHKKKDKRVLYLVLFIPVFQLYKFLHQHETAYFWTIYSRLLPLLFCVMLVSLTLANLRFS